MHGHHANITKVNLLLTEPSQVSEVGPREGEQQAPLHLSKTISLLCAKANRKSQAAFCCVACGHTDNADRNAAINISRASVMVPIVSLGSRSGYTQIGA